MRVILATTALVLVLLVLSLVLAITGDASAADTSWQGALIVLALGAAAFLLRLLPGGPVGTDRIDGTAFDDPDSFWGRWNRFYRG